MLTLERIAAELRAVVGGLEPDTFAGCDAARLTEVAAEGEKLFATARVLLAKRAVDANAWQARSGAVTPEQWLAGVSGCSEGAARQALVTVDQVSELPATEAKLREGSLSLAQAALVTKGASVDPTSEPRLLVSAERKGMRGLRADAERVVVAATDAEAAQARARRDRHLRTWTRGVETHGQFSGPTSEVNRLLDALEPLRRQVFEQARGGEGPRESQDAYRFDALMRLADGDAGERGVPTARVRVDVTALLTGTTAPGEICEIPGVGPVPVSFARQVLSHGLLELVLHDGKDVHAIVTRTRHVPEALRIAIEERDPSCKVRGCDATEHLHRHHTLDFADHELTTYELLGPLCPPHHDLVTHHGYTIETHPDGTWTLHPPAHQRPDRHTDAA